MIFGWKCHSLHVSFLISSQYREKYVDLSVFRTEWLRFWVFISPAKKCRSLRANRRLFIFSRGKRVCRMKRQLSSPWQYLRVLRLFQVEWMPCSDRARKGPEYDPLVRSILNEPNLLHLFGHSHFTDDISLHQTGATIYSISDALIWQTHFTELTLIPFPINLDAVCTVNWSSADLEMA